MRCPNGTRKNKQGVCEPKEKPVPKVEPKPVPKPVKSRCPNGTRKNKQGICEPKEKPVSKSVCPNGTQKPKGVCEPTDKSKKMATPRTKYTCKYFKKPIYLSERELFQIHFDTPGQFVNYTNLSNAPKLDCGYQSLFALGLIEVEHAKKSAEEVNAKGKVGIYTHELRSFFRINFGFTPTESIGSYETHDPAAFLHSKLSNNHATIILLKFATHGHYIVAYKYNNKIHFYDPQASKHKELDQMTLFDYFKVKVDGPKLFKPIQKTLPYIG